MRPRSLHVFRARPKAVVPLFPSSYCTGYMTTDRIVKDYGMPITSYIVVNTDEDLLAIIETENDFQEIGRRLAERFKHEPRYLKEVIKWCEEHKKMLRNYLQEKLNAQIIMTRSNVEIAKRYHEYVQLYREFHQRNTPPWLNGGEAAEKEVIAYLNKEKIKDADTVFATITENLEYESEAAAEERELLELCIKIQKAGISKVKSAQDLPNGLRKALQKHIDEYSSIPFGYNSGVVWDDKHFVDKINTIIANNPTKTRKDKVEELDLRIQKRDLLMKQLKLPLEIERLVVALRQLTYLQDLKKTTQTRSHPLLQLVVHKEIGRRIGAPAWLLSYAPCDEIEELLRKGSKATVAYVKLLQQRHDFSVMIEQKGKYSWLYGNQAREFAKVNGLLFDAKAVKEIRGMVASKGKAKGTVKVCRTSPEAAKVKQGDILVTAMTTPDFIPAMKRAAAIITDEGGITCHAAIVSRELGKPCVIGTKIATKALKDGDIVEVDAEKGIVRKL